MIVRRLRQHQRPSDGQAPEPEKKRREPARPTPPVTLAPAALALALISTPAAASVPQMVHDRATAVLGARWAPVAVALARKESSFRCNAVGPPTRHGRARGVFQVMPGSARALGYDYAKLFNCGYGIEAGLAHMKLCISYGVKTDRQMFSCHLRGVAGWR